MGHPMGGMAARWGMMRSMRRKDELGGKQGRPRHGAAGAAVRQAVPRRHRALPGPRGRLVRRSRVATPVLAGDVINAITGGQPDAGRRGRAGSRCSSPAWRWSTRCSRSVQRCYSARIGEGIIYDLRTQVYDHVQRMPLQFFTRTQTGALVSRLNNDVHRRPAGVHVHAVRHGRQRHRARAHRRRDVLAVLAGHRCCRWCWCRRSSCRPGWSGGGWPRSPASRTSSTRR